MKFRLIFSFFFMKVFLVLLEDMLFLCKIRREYYNIFYFILVVLFIVIMLKTYLEVKFKIFVVFYKIGLYGENNYDYIVVFSLKIENGEVSMVRFVRNNRF